MNLAGLYYTIVLPCITVTFFFAGGTSKTANFHRQFEASCFRFPLTPVLIVLELTGTDSHLSEAVDEGAKGEIMGKNMVKKPRNPKSQRTSHDKLSNMWMSL